MIKVLPNKLTRWDFQFNPPRRKIKYIRWDCEYKAEQWDRQHPLEVNNPYEYFSPFDCFYVKPWLKNLFRYD